VRAHWPVVKEDGLVAIKKRIDIYKNTVVIEEI